MAVTHPQEVLEFFLSNTSESLVRLSWIESIELFSCMPFLLSNVQQRAVLIFCGELKTCPPFLQKRSEQSIPCWELRSVVGLLHSLSRTCSSGRDVVPWELCSVRCIKKKRQRLLMEATWPLSVERFHVDVGKRHGHDSPASVGECLFKWRTRA